MILVYLSIIRKDYIILFLFFILKKYNQIYEVEAINI